MIPPPRPVGRGGGVNYPHQSSAYRWGSSEIAKPIPVFSGSSSPTEQPTMLPVITGIRVKVKVKVRVQIRSGSMSVLSSIQDHGRDQGKGQSPDPSSESGWHTSPYPVPDRSLGSSPGRIQTRTQIRIRIRTPTQVHGVFSAITISATFQITNNLVCKLTNNYFWFVGRHLGLTLSVLSGSIFAYLKQTDY